MRTHAPLLVLALAACTPAGGPAPAAGGAASGGPRVELTARLVEPVPDAGALPAAPVGETGARAEGGAGSVAVRGRMETPDPCRRLAGSVEAAGNRLTLRVDAVREGEMCAQVIAAFAYEAAVIGLAPGTYRLRVVHAYPGTGWDPRTALEQDVTVR
ncbi:MAG: hypothetical protein AB1941_11125 [Gemmatimonadota bacterium]